MTPWQVTGPLSHLLRAENPGPMTLTGTNSFLIFAPGAQERVVVDPGPRLESHLAALASAGPIGLILLTHGHSDHSEGALRLHELTGAPVRALDETFTHGASVLEDGEIINSAGILIEVLAVPGHTADSVCFRLPQDGPNGSVLTGDTILGQGTTVLDFPGGTLSDYLASLERLSTLAAGHGPITLLPGHGPVRDDLGAVVEEYTAHRLTRLAQVRAAVVLLQDQGIVVPTAQDVANLVYAQVPSNLRAAALLSVASQLAHLGFSTGTQT